MSHVVGPPSLSIIEPVSRDRGPGMRLHEHVRLTLRNFIDSNFEDGQQFWTETTLARQLDVSVVTVRHALSDLSREGILYRQASKGTVVRKNRSMDQGGYVVGIVVPEVRSCLLTRIVNFISSHCRADNRRVSIYHTHQNQNIESIYKMLHPPSAERLVLLANVSDKTWEMYEVLREQGYWTVNIDTLLDDYPGAYVGVDNVEGIRLGIEHLVSLGHERITYLVNEPMVQGSVSTRVHAFDSITRDQGLLQCRIIHCCTASWENSNVSAYKKMKQIWEQPDRPTAIFTSSDHGALGVLKWCREQGVRVPQDLSVLGFDDDDIDEYTVPPLTSIAQPYEQIAERALRILEQADAGGIFELLAPTLVLRESTASLKGLDTIRA